MKEASRRARIARLSEVERAEFRLRVSQIVKSDPTNVLLDSFRKTLSEGHAPGERFVEFGAWQMDEPVGRCETNFSLLASDIDAYGNAAAQMLRDGRMAALGGDLVFPQFRGRGLQRQMIEFRLGLLRDQDYSIAVCGILENNEVSRANYLGFGFRPVGEKRIVWNISPGTRRTTLVTLHALGLRDK